MNANTRWIVGPMAMLLGLLAASQGMATEPSASTMPTFPRSPVTMDDQSTPRQSDAPKAPANQTPRATAKPAEVAPSQSVPLATVPGITGPAVPLIGAGPIPPRLPPPTIGFHYILIPGGGYKIVSVAPFSAAARMCLDYGDVVLAINGCPMTYYGADIPVRAKAAATDGWLTAYVFDQYTGLLVTRTANLFGPAAPPPAAGPTPIAPAPLVSPPATLAPTVPQAEGRSSSTPTEKPAQPAPHEKSSQGPETKPPAPAPPAPPTDNQSPPSSKESPASKREPPPAKA